MKEYKIIEDNNELSLAEEPGRKFDLEQRLIDFSIEIIQITELLPSSIAGRHFSGQLIRSGTAPALNYGEAQSAESRNDFIHKMKICIKELRESNISLKIIHQSSMLKDDIQLNKVLKECNELISIFSKSISTAKENNLKTKQ